MRAAIEAAVGHFHGHEQEVFVHRDIALAAGADHRGQQRGLGGIGDVINIYAVKISLEEMVALEREVRVREGELSDHDLQWLRDLHSAANAELLNGFLDFRIIGIGGAELKRVGLLHELQVLHAHGRFASVVEPGSQLVAGIVDVGAGHSRGQRRGGSRRKRVRVGIRRFLGFRGGLLLRGWRRCGILRMKPAGAGK